MVFPTEQDAKIPPLHSHLPNMQQSTVTPITTNMFEHLSLLKINGNPACVRLTNIVCAIGSSTDEDMEIKDLIESGVNIARFNFFLANTIYLSDIIERVRNAIDDLERIKGVKYPVALAFDLQGFEIKTGLIASDHDLPIVVLELNSIVNLTTDKGFIPKCTKELIYVAYDDLTKVLSPGKLVLLNNGAIKLKVLEVYETTIMCKVIQPGELRSYTTVHLPGTDLINFPLVVEEDLRQLKFVIEKKIDIVFANNIRCKDNVVAIRNALGDKVNKIAIIAGISDSMGINNLDDIINEADGVLIDRDSLTASLGIKKLPTAQKMITMKAQRKGKSVICSTMLRSLVKSPSPAIADIMDVCNAVHDCVDAVSLSGDTAIGKYPVESVKFISKICKEAESAIHHMVNYDELVKLHGLPKNAAECVALSATLSSYLVNAAFIIALTRSGRTAKMISRYRPRCPIIAVTRSPSTANLCHLYRGVVPMLYEEPTLTSRPSDLDARVSFGLRMALNRHFAESGSQALLVLSHRPGNSFADCVIIVTVGKETRGLLHGTVTNEVVLPYSGIVCPGNDDDEVLDEVTAKEFLYSTHSSSKGDSSAASIITRF